MNLASGNQIMRLTVTDQPLFNIDKISFMLHTAGMRTDLQKTGFSVCQDAAGDLLVNAAEASPLNQIDLYHISGALVKSVVHPGPIQRISTSGLDPGIYLVRARSGKQLYHKKIMLK